VAFEVPQHYRKRPRQTRSRRTVDALLDATEEVLRTHGYPGASTNRIARAAGLSVGSLYQYFGDKDGLIGAAIERALAREAESLVGQAEDARGFSLAQGVSHVVGSVIRSRIAQRALLEVLSEHGLRFGPGTTVQLVSRHQRGHADPLQRLLAGRRAELRDGPVETFRFTTSALLNTVSFAFAVEKPTGLRAEALAGLLAAAITHYLVSPPPRVGAASAGRTFDVTRLRSLLEASCRSSAARAAILDEFVFEEQQALDALAAVGAAPEAVCDGLLRFWAGSGRELARAAGAASLTGPSIDLEAWALRAERRSRGVRSWLLAAGAAPTESVEAAVFVLGHAFLELGLLFAQSRDPAEVLEERLADAAALLGICARLACGEGAALTSSAKPQ
jgi:AcrR family transcriptional regulator